MKFPALLFLAFAVLVPSAPTADAAVIGTTKVKDMPSIANLAVTDDGFSFEIVSMPPVSKYDVWLGAGSGKAKASAKRPGRFWYMGSVAARRGKKAPKTASFATDVADLLRFEREGTYEVSAYLCPTNMKKPNATGCARASAAVEAGK